ncbi:unnamed protein product, partial [Staurois parvus]
RGSRSTQCGDRRCAVSAQSCYQLCPITADHIGDMYTDHQSTDDHPSSATCQCPSVSALSAHPCHLPVPISATSVPHFSAHQCHINATYQCPSELPFSVTHQCQSVPPINASQCHLSVLPISATYQCQSVPPISASQCRLSVCISAAYQCPSV